uniref:Uncharacterized protein n=1 Tax=Anguilla anguilla TaxID=7936 RepID=A0A0E9PMY2_ANGAN
MTILYVVLHAKNSWGYVNFMSTRWKPIQRDISSTGTFYLNINMNIVKWGWGGS